MSPHSVRTLTKRALAAAGSAGSVDGASLLIYHRVGGGTRDELDVARSHFTAQLELLTAGAVDVVAIDTALDRIDSGDSTPSVVLTFDDGFADVYDNAWPLLRERGVPFTLYLASAYMGRRMVWESSTAKGPHGQGVTWAQLEEMVDSGLCTIGNHTHNHVRPEVLTVEELDECSETIRTHLGVTPRHFTYPWGVSVPDLEPALAERFRSSSTGELGRNDPHTHRQRLKRIPVRQSDPLSFFEAKLTGDLRAEHAYERLVTTAKSVLRRLPGSPS